jgi:4-azaleucine resistance transporter AzlC
MSFLQTFRNGSRAGFPIAIGYIPVAIAFGILARSADIPYYVAAMMSAFVFAGASQFVAVGLLQTGTAIGEIVLTVFVLNFRHLLMSASLATRIESGVTRGKLYLLAFGVTDETFSVASLRPEDKLSAGFLIGLNGISFAAWNAGTWAGLFLASGFPEAVQSSMGIALYAMFVGLLVPSARAAKPVLFVALTSATLFCTDCPGSRGFPLVGES